MDEFWKFIWKSFPISPWSVALYLALSWWASKKIPFDYYKRIPMLASWVDSISVLGILVLVGDIFWLSLSWLRWNAIYLMDFNTYIFLPIVRNIAMIPVCIILMSRNWMHEGYIKFSRQVQYLIGLNILFIILNFYLAPGMEWTHWLYALQNNYACWPYTWFISYPIGRMITSLVYIKMWRTPNVT